MRDTSLSLAVAVTLMSAASATLFGNGRVAVANKGNFFQSIFDNFEAAPKDKKGFVHKCSKIVKDLLPELREEYTEKQVPSVLFHSCEDFKIKEDFRRSEHNKSWSTPVLTRARTQCRYFAGTLAKQFQGKKDYKGWCGNVYKYLTELALDPKQTAKLIRERNDVRSQLQKLQKQWEDWRKSRAGGWAARRKFKKELEPWAGDFDPSDGKQIGSDDDSTSEGPGDAPEDTDSPLNVTGDDWRQCCPKGCKVCNGYKVFKGVVRVNLAISASATTESSTEAQEVQSDAGESKTNSSSEESEDEEADSTEDAEEEDDDKEEAQEVDQEADEDKDEDKDQEDAEEEDQDDDSDISSENDDADAAKPAKAEEKKTDDFRSSHLAPSLLEKAPHEQPAAPVFFWTRITEFKNGLPKTKEFMQRCEKVIKKTMPVLHEEYTWKQVPHVLGHECDIYATKTDFRPNNKMKLEKARTTCKFFADRLGKTFQTNKDYKGWCSDVYAHLLRESEMENMTDKQKQMLKDQADLTKKIHGQAPVGCCPANCKFCK